MRISALVLSTLSISSSIDMAAGHGHLWSPRSRNWYAYEEGVDGSNPAGSDPEPTREYCSHCLNKNGVCGASPNLDYNDWLDSNGAPMPWRSQATYQAGDIITVESYLDTHHNGHMEISACLDVDHPDQACFDQNQLTFVSGDMPADPAYPNRGYYAGGQGGATKHFFMTFKLPDGLHGDKVLLQWRYITANSCSPPGYGDYFGGANSDGTPLPDSYWTPGLGNCEPPYPLSGARSTVWPEQFWNCAEVTILDPQPTISPKPTPAPTTAKPTLTREPTEPPVDSSDACCSQNYKTCESQCGATTQAQCEASDQMCAWLATGPLTSDSCQARWGDCTNDQGSCCPGLACTYINDFYSQCLPANPYETAPPSPSTPVASPPTKAPTNDSSPTVTPASPSSPTKSPTDTSRGCCSHDFKTCMDSCGDTEATCGFCSTTDVYAWLTNGSLENCHARWGDCTYGATPCCPGLACVEQSQYYSQCLPEA